MLSFNWQHAKQQAADSEYGILLSQLRPVRQLRAGELYQCQHCQAWWYLDQDQTFAQHLEQHQLAFIDDWQHSDSLQLPADMRHQLEQIGSVPACDYGKQLPQVFPCQVTTIDGQVWPFAEIVVQRKAPVNGYRNFRLASDIAAISPSPYALPQMVRQACAHAMEIRMGFAPTLLILSNGQQIIINGGCNFLNINDVDSQQTRVGHLPNSMAKFPPIHHSKVKVVSFIATP